MPSDIRHNLDPCGGLGSIHYNTKVNRFMSNRGLFQLPVVFLLKLIWETT